MDSNGSQFTRRNVMKSISAAGALMSLDELAIEQAIAAKNSDDVQLGKFSDGFDGWTTTGNNSLTRISKDEMPTAVQAGTHTLGVEIDGDLHPAIGNKKRVKKADFANHPYVMAHVLGYAEETDSDMVFTFRLHHTHTPAGGQDDGGKDVLVEESDEQTVGQFNPQYIRWDLSNFDEEVLRSANRLEIVWYLEEYPPKNGHSGQNRGDFDYQGLVAVDDIRLTDDVASEKTQASQEKRMSLHREHGTIVDRTFEKRTEDAESGTLVYADGSEVPYSFEVLDDGQFRYTIDGETFLLGGGDDE